MDCTIILTNLIYYLPANDIAELNFLHKCDGTNQNT